MEAEIAKTNDLLQQGQVELDTLKHDLALEKMEKASAQADLETALNRKPDTSELDALRKELQTLKDQKPDTTEADALRAELQALKDKKPDTSEADALREELEVLKGQHQVALMTAQEESQQAREEHLATKEILGKAQAELVRQKAEDASELAKAQAEIERQKKESSSDYKDMHDSMTQLVEEANKSALSLEARLKEVETNLKVKDAELAEAKVCVAFAYYPALA